MGTALSLQHGMCVTVLEFWVREHRWVVWSTLAPLQGSVSSTASPKHRDGHVTDSCARDPDAENPLLSDGHFRSRLPLQRRASGTQKLEVLSDGNCK